MHVVVTYPGRHDETIRSFLHRYQPSPTRGRVGTCIAVFEAINVHSHYNLHARRIAYTILYTEGSNDLVT